MTLKNAIAELPEGTRTFFEDTLISIAHCGKYTDYRSKSQDNHCPENRLKETNLYHRFLEKLKERKEYIAAQNFDLNQLEVNSMDYRRFLRAIPPNTVNLLLTDPPYGDNAQYFEHAQRVHPLMNYSLSADNDRLHNEVVISNAPSRTDKHGKEQFLVDMHPQMQHAFAEYLEAFLGKITSVGIQTFLTSHSAHVANTMVFSKIRYTQKTKDGVTYKNLSTFAQENPTNINFIRKYLTLTKCDLFFADKAIFVEGASERLLLPDMIEKCAKAGDFDSQAYKLPAQYYTLIEIGGAYAYKFIPFIEFLGIPCLILTDLDSVLGTEGKNGRTYYKSVPVYLGETTSNETIKWWWRKSKGLSEDDKGKIPLTEITLMTADEKTKGKCHLEFQTKEQGLCGHSLEEAIRNVNRAHYELEDTITEDDIEFSGKSKTDFALDLVYECDDYTIPAYIKSGLKWLNEQKILE